MNPKAPQGETRTYNHASLCDVSFSIPRKRKFKALAWTPSRAQLAFPPALVYSSAALISRRHETIVPIILAAGSSRRLGFPKPLARFHGKTALQLAVENCARLVPPIIVLGCDAAKIRRALPPGVRAVLNRDWRAGQMSSLRRALRHIDPRDAFMIYPVDHPLLRKATVRKLLAAFNRRFAARQIVMPRHKNRLGHPVIFAAKLRKEFFFTPTAREIVYRDPRRNLVIEVPTAAIYEDFDTPSSYRRCLQKFPRHTKR